MSKATLRKQLAELMERDFGFSWRVKSIEGEQTLDEILKLISKEIKKKLPTHKGKMLSRTEVKKVITDTLGEEK